MGRINNSLVASDDVILKDKGYEIDRVLGEGSYSKVKLAIWNKPGITESQQVAIKIINRTTAPKDFLEKFWPRERDLMEVMEHDNVIRMFDVFSEGNKIYMSLERAAHGDLLEYIKLKGALTEVETHRLFSEMCNGVDYLHKKNIIHRDLKCENILLTETNTVKIADFGFARTIDRSDKSRTFCGSAAYAAPEVLKGVPYEGSIPDIWSMGVILFIMACCVMPFRDSSIARLLKDQQLPSIQFPDQLKLSQTFKNLVSGILRYDLKKRYTLPDILRHKWMKTTPKGEIMAVLSTTDSGFGSLKSSDSTINSDVAC